MPSIVNVGGDVRFLSLQKDNKITESQVGFPMQGDLELAVGPLADFTLSAAFGIYDGKTESRRYYLKYQINDNWMARASRFYPAFGIANPDHSLLVRRLTSQTVILQP